jgi:hypothetical protein
MELISGTKVYLHGDRDTAGTVEFPDPDQTPPDVGMVLVVWDHISYPVWEYVEDLTTA